VLGACIAESYSQYKSAEVLTNALNFYINDTLRHGIVPNGTTDINTERASAANEQIKQNVRCYTWMQIYLLFEAVRNGAEVITTLSYIQNMQFNVNDL
jgi:hypothetical protein